ncbi:MAG TPA: SpoVR family protein, partial [Bacillota bacterium]|nr:SpoVR family protein [Bacillota bacterium]
MSQEIAILNEANEKIAQIASGFGLDYFDMFFEICPADILYTFGAYGMPTRFTHWSFGKAFYRMKTSYDYNLSRIYELVINSDPCYAFLLEGNTIIQNKLVIAHVYAHCDFFKNNACFAPTNRKMVESMAVSAARIAEYEFKYGLDTVETFLDAVLSIQEHINPDRLVKRVPPNEDQSPQAPASPYDDLWNLDKAAVPVREVSRIRRIPPRPEKDLLLFIMENARDLEPWQQDILSICREEMLYFWPQLETKIMNEGWASYWHARIMRELELTEDEAIEFAKMNASIIQPSKVSINPYYLGLKIWEDLEKRWDVEKMFEIRETESDMSFLRNYLTKELVDKLDLYLYKKNGHQWQVSDTAWETVRD